MGLKEEFISRLFGLFGDYWEATKITPQARPEPEKRPYIHYHKRPFMEVIYEEI